MEHTNRWQTRLKVTSLEERAQPGSILMSGIELGALSEVIAQPVQNDAPTLKRPMKSEDIQIVAPVQDAAQKTSAPKSAPVEVNTESTQQSNSKSIANPALHRPATPTNDRANVGSRQLLRTETQLTMNGETRIELKGIGGVTPGQPARITDGMEMGGGSGVKAPNFASYDGGTDRADGVNDVEPGVGAQAGNFYTAGFQGRSGTVRLYNGTTGALIASKTFPPNSGNRVQIRGIDVSPTTGEVFVVGTEKTPSGTVLANFVHKVAGALGGAPVFPADYAATTYDVATDFVRAFEEVAVSPDGTDVIVTGWSDISLTGTEERTIDFHYDGNLAPNSLGFIGSTGIPSHGHGVDIDASGTRYIARDRGADARPNYIAVADDNVTLPWGGSVSVTCNGFAPVFKASNGAYGIITDGTSVYIAGTTNTTDATFNPPVGSDTNYDLNVVIKADVATGLVQSYGSCNAIPGGDYAAQDADLDLATGNLYTTGWADEFGSTSTPQANHAGDLSEFDSLGALTNFRVVGDVIDATPNSKTTNGRGVAVYSATRVAAGGETNCGVATASGTFSQYGSNFAAAAQGLIDSDFGATGGSQLEGPPSDGYYVGDNLPIGQ